MPPPPPPPQWDFQKFAGSVPPAPHPFWVPKAPAPPPPGMFQNSNSASAGGLSQREELVQMAQKRSRRRLLELKQRLKGVITETGANLERLFRSFDTNRDGAVDYEEFKAGISGLATTPSEPEYDSLFYEAGNEAEEASSSQVAQLEASGALVSTTLVWAEGMEGWTPWSECKQLFIAGETKALTEQDMQDMMMLLDTDGDGEIDYSEFAAWFGAGPPPPPVMPEVQMRIEAQASAGDHAQEHLNAIKIAAEKRSRKMMMNLKRDMGKFFQASSISLEQQFRGFDTNGDGAIDHDEFKNGLLALGADITDSQIEDLISMLDTDGDGEIDYEEFSRWFGAGPPPPPMTPEMVFRAQMQQEAGERSPDRQAEHLNAIQSAAEKRSRKLLMQLKTELSGVFKSSGVSLERQFRGFDTNGDGAIDHDEFRNGLMSLGANVSEAQIYDLITILDKDGDGEIDYREFSLWFGQGPPPPPVLPQVRNLQEARSNSNVDTSALLAEIEAKAKARRPPPPPTPEMVARIEARAAQTVGSGSPEQRHLAALREHAQARAEKRSRTLMLDLKRQLSGVLTQTGAKLDQVFRSFDANGDGEIDYQEFKDGLLHLGADLSMGQLEDLITILDDNGDGVIDYEEFARWFGSGPPPAPMLPQAKAMEAAKAEHGGDASALLAEIEAAGRKRGINIGGGPPTAPKPYWIPNAPPPVPAGMFTNSGGSGGGYSSADMRAAADKRSRQLMLKLKTELSGVFKANGVSLERQFRGFDTNGDGAIDHDEFKAGLDALGSSLSASQINDLIMILDKDGDGEIDYSEFAAWFGAGPPPPPILPEVRERMTAQASAGDMAQEHLNAIQMAAEKRNRTKMMNLKRDMGAIFAASKISLEQQFRGFDTNGDGAIDYDEFKNGLAALGAQLSDAQIEDLICMLDTDGDGEIDYEEFSRWFGAGPPPPPMTPEMVFRAQMQQEAGERSPDRQAEHLNAIQSAAEKRSRKLLMQLKTELSGVFKANGVSLERQFRGFDANGDGAIDHDEFRDGLMSLGANIAEAQIMDLITILDKDGDGEIDYHEFAAWFGAGPPPPPVLPQAKMMMDARASSTVDPNALLREIEARGNQRRRGPPPPPPPPLGGLGGGGGSVVDRKQFLSEISHKAGQMGGSLGAIEAAKSGQVGGDRAAFLVELTQRANARSSNPGGGGGSREDFLSEIEAAASRRGVSVEEVASGSGGDRAQLIMEIEQAASRSSPPARGGAKVRVISEGIPQRSSAKRVGSGVVANVLNAMATHRGNAAVQSAACSALWSMAYKNPQNRREIVSAGGLQLLLGALRTHPAQASLQAAGCAVMASLATDEGVASYLVSDGALELVSAALQAHVADAAVAETASVALANLNSAGH